MLRIHPLSIAAMLLITLNSRRYICQSFSLSTSSSARIGSSGTSSTAFSTIIHSLNAVESRELRFYNGTPSPVTSSTSASDASTTSTAAAASFPTSPSFHQVNKSIETPLSSSSASAILDTKSFDLSQQASYFTSLFKKSSHENTNDNHDNLSVINRINNHLNQKNKRNYSSTSSSTSRAGTSSASSDNSSSSSSSSSRTNNQQMNPSITPQIQLTKGEQELFDLLAQVIKSNNISSTLRVAGGWVRDKLLATEEFHRDSTTSSSSISIGSMSSSASTSISSTGLVDRLTSKYNGPSLGRNGSKLIGLSKTSPSTTSSAMTLIDSKDLPVDIDVALDDMLGREFADHLNEWLTQHGQETISVGVVLKNPEKSKHLETATMKVGKFWIDFVNLRAEEYTEDSRIPDLMRIGTAHEDAYRRDLTINALFYNINTGQVEDFTGRGVDDLKKGVVATPLPPLTTLLDDPLRVLRSVRFAARLRFTMEESLKNAAMNERVRIALSQKVARERIGAEVDLMLRSQDPVGAIRLLINLNLAGTVFAIDGLQQQPSNTSSASDNDDFSNKVFQSGLNLLSTTHDHLVDCKVNTPIWCEKKRVTAAATNGVNEVVLMEDEECRRKLWYASFLKPLRDHFKVMRQEDKEKVGRRQGKKANRSMIMKVMVDELKRPVRDAEAVEAIMKGADDFTNLLNAGCDLSSIACLVAEIRIINSGFAGSKISNDRPTCLMGKKNINCETEDDPVWCGAMEYRLLVSKVLTRLGPLWRAALVLSLSEQLALIEHEDFSYTIEGDVYEEAQEEKRIGLVQTYDAFAASLLQLGLVGIWSQEPLIDGKVMKSKDILPNIPKGPVFREIMDEQENWMNMHPGGSKEGLVKYLREVFHEYI